MATCLATTFPSHLATECSHVTQLWSIVNEENWEESLQSFKRKMINLFFLLPFMAWIWYRTQERKQHHRRCWTCLINYQSSASWGHRAEYITRSGNPQPLVLCKMGPWMTLWSRVTYLCWISTLLFCLSLCFQSVFITAISQSPNYFGCSGLSWHDVLIQNSSQFTFWAYRNVCSIPCPFLSSL